MMGLPRPRGAFSLFFTTTLLLLLSFHGFAKEVSSGKGDTPLPVIHWGGCGISKLGFMKDLAKAYTEETGIRIELEGGGATKGIRKTAERKLDLGGSCRLPLVLKNQDGIYSVASNERRIKMIPVGWDALVVITNKANKEVTAISREQLQKVFTGEITNWGQLGAATDRPINLYIRKGKISGVGLTLRQQLFNNRDQAFTSRATVLPSSGKIEKAIEKDPYGIAVSGISSSRHRQVNMLKLDGVEPSMASLKSSKYTLFRILFLVAPGDYAQRKELKGFVDLAHSPKGQRIMEHAGTLPYHRGVHLLFTAASYEYLHAIDVVERSAIYTLSEN